MLGAALLSGLLAWQPPVTVAAGAAAKGVWRQNESHYRYVDDPSVAMADSGDALVAWADQLRKDVFLQRWDPEGTRPGAPVNVSRSPQTFSWLPRVAVSGRQVYVLWQEIIFSGGSHGGDILFARSDDGGATFGEPLNLSDSAAGDGKGRITREHWHNGSLDIAVARDGTLFAAWTEYEGALWLARSTDGGRSFHPRQRLAGSDREPARAPALAVCGERPYVAWTTGDIHLLSLADGELRVFGRRGRYADAPKLAVDGRGVLHLAYADEGVIRYSAGLAEPRPISPRGAGFPSLAVDGKDRVYVLWERRPGLALTVTPDGGDTFAAPQIVPGTAGAPGGGQQGLLMRKLVAGRAGALAVVHSTFERGEASRIVLIRAQAK